MFPFYSERYQTANVIEEFFLHNSTIHVADLIRVYVER